MAMRVGAKNANGRDAGPAGRDTAILGALKSALELAAGPAVAPGVPRVATDGGFGVVDASSRSPRASTVNGFMFASGPARRFVAEARRSHPKAGDVISGGESGNPAGP